MADKVVQALAKKPRQATLSSYEPTFREKASDVLRALLFSDDREGQRKAERLSNVLETVTPYGVATGIDDMREAVGQGDYATAGMMGAMAMVPGPNPKIRAYHGSPHSFARFDMSKIGTGEGAQAYGHGLYFAENEKVAKQYRDTLGGATSVEIDGKPTWQKGQNTIGLGNNVNATDIATDALQRFADPEQAAWWLRGQTGQYEKPGWTKARDEAIELLNSGRGKVNVDGSMYEVNINASPDDFIDWDKPLSEQPSVQQRLAQIGEASKSSTTTGMEKITRMGDVLPDRAAVTAKLREAGIPGIKYLDAGSRGKGDGSRNYVVFDDKLIEIVRKYGIAGASAMLGYNLLDSIDPAQAKQLEQLEQVRKLDSIFGGAR